MDKNYLNFLHQLLAKHAQDKYNVTKMKWFSFKYYSALGGSPPTDYKFRCETMDIDTVDDYKEMVKKLCEANPASIKVSVDIKDVSKLSQRKGQENDTKLASDDEEPVDDSAADGVSTLDCRLAKWRIDLEKKYQNKTLLVQQLTNLGLLLGTPTTVPSTAAHATTPTTPTRKVVILDQPGSSPPIPILMTLGCFLRHAEDKLGVVNATSYELQSEGIGPDILSDVDDQTLQGKELKRGDIIRLKKGSSLGGVARMLSVLYEKRFKEGGGCRFSGPPMKVDEDGNRWSPNSDYDLWYFCEARKEWVQVPPGYIVDEE
ncbi:hypothetical protein HYDPIDRAFT_171653, partial [Hydnomerulius pinastri MD-312]